MPASTTQGRICLPELHAVLGVHCMQHLTAYQLAGLRQVSRAMRDLVDDHTHEAWTMAASDLVQDQAKPTGCATGADWQIAIRHEWNTQRHVRSGKLQQVVKVAARDSAAGRWATVSRHGPCCSYFLSPQKDGTLLFLNADAEGTQPMLLSMRIWGTFHGFVRKNGMLGLVEASDYRTRPCQLTWHTVDASTGQTLSSEQRHHWTLDNHIQDHVFNAATHRAVAVTDHHSLVVMDADTLQEVSRLTVLPQHTELDSNALSLGKLAWSHDGQKLAVTLENIGKCTRSPLPVPYQLRTSLGTSEVQIYDITTRQCLQSVLLRSAGAVIKFSSSLQMLAVHCHSERYDPDGANPTNKSNPRRPMSGDRKQGSTIRILEPALHRAVLVEPENILDFEVIGDACSWSPCGTFLLTCAGSTLRPWGADVLDPHTLKRVFKAPEHMSSISWALGNPLHSKGRVLMAYLAQSKICIKFWQKDGEWQSEGYSCGEFEFLHRGYITPDGATLVALCRPSQDASQQHCQAGSSQFNTHHLALDDMKGHTVATGFQCNRGGPQLRPEWARFPCGWPQLHAYVHKDKAKALQCVKLVDARVHKEVSRFAITPRHKELGEVALSLGSLAWSRTGSHLAVHLGKFGQHRPTYWPAVHNRSYDASANSEVQVYDASSGQCMQSIFLKAPGPSLAWSSSQDLLMVFCDLERCSPNNANRIPEIIRGLIVDDPVGVEASVRVLQPTSQRAVLIQTQFSKERGLHFSACHWTPCGALLAISHYRITSVQYERAWSVHDPFTLHCIFESRQPAQIVWGSKAPLTDGHRILTAFQALPASAVKCWQEDGKWQAAQQTLGALSVCMNGSLASAGDMLVALAQEHPAPQHSDDKCIVHYDLKAQQKFSIASGFRNYYTSSCGRLSMAWTGFPGLWKQMYAYIHANGCSESVRLVDVGCHKVVGSWTAVQLKSQAMGRSQRRQPEPEGLEEDEKHRSLSDKVCQEDANSRRNLPQEAEQQPNNTLCRRHTVESCSLACDWNMRCRQLKPGR
ncbi:hypothetical protein WJX74_002738 [Apatococcus lobatus]|uniref:F-box domain-containing protein n=1 Tax=Apatococcus lobatus TaxID=904363 RepID=A0AAW1S252_9CHLO